MDPQDLKQDQIQQEKKKVQLKKLVAPPRVAQLSEFKALKDKLMMAQNAPAVITFDNLIDIDIKESSPVNIEKNN